MKNVVLIVICFLVITVGSVQVMSNTPPEVKLSGNTGEYLNATIYFSDVPTETLTGYEKWITDGKTLDRSLKASDLGIELIYPKVVDVRDGKAKVDITVRVERAGNYTGAIFYRTSGQTGIAAGTWIKINIADSSSVTNEESMSVWQTLSNILRRFWNYVTGFFATAEASNVTMNTSVNVVPTPTQYPSGGGRGGGSTALRDTDGDGISDIYEMLTGTDWKDPCSPNPNCAACLAIKPLPIPIVTPVPTLVPTPTVVPQEPPSVSITPKPIPEVIEPPAEPKEKSNLHFYGFCFGLAVVAFIFLVYKAGKKAIEREEDKK